MEHICGRGKRIKSVRPTQATKPRRTQQTPTIRHNGIEATTFKDKADLLRRVMFPAPPQFQPLVSSTTINPLPWTEITDQEIREAIFTSAPKKAAGPDGLLFLCLREAYNAIPTWFHQLFRACIANGYHPLCWREAKGAILAKPNKSDY